MNREDLLYRPHRYRILNSKFKDLIVAAWGTKAQADKKVEEWIAKEKNLKGATFEEIKEVVK